MDRLAKYLSNNSLGKEALPWGFSLLLYCYTLNKFNLVVGNSDDHVKNHGMLCRGQGRWRLAPAFDLVAQLGTHTGKALEAVLAR